MSSTESDEEILEAVEAFEEQQGGAVSRRGQFEFQLTPFRDRQARSYGVRRRSYHLRLNNSPDTFPVGHGNIVRAFEEGLSDVIEELIDDLPEHDRIQIYLSSNRLRSAHTTANVSIGDWRNPLSGARQILHQITKMLNSNENFDADDSLQLDVTHITMPRPGSGKRKWRFGTDNYDTLLKTKRSIITINNRDEYCCARALVVAKAMADDDPMKISIRKGRLIQKERAIALQEDARVPPGPCGLDALKLFEIVLADYQLIVVSAEHAHSIVHKGPHQEKQLMLLMHDGHFSVITSLAAFFSKVHFCLKCDKGFNHDDLQHHRCQGTKCYCCHQTDCPDFRLFSKQGPASLPCQQCGRTFFGVTCHVNHLIKTTSGQPATSQEKNAVCQTHRACSVCGLVLRKTERAKHVCGENECPSCHKVCNLRQHKCFIQSVKKPKKKKKKERRGAAAGRQTCRANQRNPTTAAEEEEEGITVFVYFDIEARQDTGNHIANLLCAETDQNDRPWTFEGEDCVKDFLQWVCRLSHQENPPVEQVIVVAHNFKGYDGYMILEELYRQHVSNLNHIVNGAKILSLELPQIKFIDSLNFFPMPLSDFPSMFGLTDLKKGFFPHFFNTTPNQNYVGYMPDIHYFDPDGMSPKQKAEFLAWHAQQVKDGYLFRFQDELINYCRSDVRLLKQGCMQFQRQFKSIVGINPMEKCITIASACLTAYRLKWMPLDTIAVEPLHGWRPRHVHSKIALEWLYWEEHQCRREDPPAHATPPRIVHAGNQGEHRLNHGPLHRYVVDGYDDVTKTVYQFQGCFTHGCITHFPIRNQRHPWHDGKTMHSVRQATDKQSNNIRSLGYHLKEMWECQWNRLKQTNPDIMQFVKNLEIVSPLNPRDAFFGGRTNAIKLYHRVEPDEQIWYVDVCSLYPWVNKNGNYPVGHPEFIDQPNHTDITPYFGFIKCKVEPPRQLYHPVLPYRHDKKLTFPLCRTCVEREPAKPMHERTWTCKHDANERALTGTWCTPELQKAVEKGYKVLYIYEVWHFKDASTTLFKEYVNTFLKMKQESSGWPKECDTETKRAQYLDDYARHEGIALDRTKIISNPGLRKLCKLMLNSHWGKYGQRPNQTQVTSFTQPSAFFKLLQDDSQTIHRIEVINDHMIEVFHSYVDECNPIQTNVNVFIASFTTCYARLKLYEALELLDQRVLYFDTDSVIYTWKPGQAHVPLGNYLGDFTNEMKRENDFIREFVAAGPKNYAYITDQQQVECKVRGFTLNIRGQQVLNFHTMKDLVLSEILSPEDAPRTLTLTNPHKIQRIPINTTIQTVSQDKTYKLVFDKRVLDSDTYQSYPYGYL